MHESDYLKDAVGGCSTCFGSIEEVQYFGPIGTPSIESQIPQNFDRKIAANWQASAPRARLFRVVSTVREVQRRPAGLVTPLTVPQIKNADPAVSSVADRSGMVKLRIYADAMGFNPRVFRIDAGKSFMLYAKSVRVELTAPSRFRKVPNGNPQPTGAGLMVLDGVIGVAIMGIEQSICCDETLNRYMISSGLIGPDTDFIPRGATSVFVHRSGAASPTATFEYGDRRILGGAAGVFQMAVVTAPTFVAAVPGATHVTVDGALTTTFYDLAWSIKP